MSGIQRIQPAINAYTITPSNTVDITNGGTGSVPCDSIYVGEACASLAVVFPSGNTQIFTNIPAGTILPVRAQRVNSTNTTALAAGALVALFNRP